MRLPRDHIDIERLSCRCIVGTLPHERESPQPVIIDLRLWIDLTEAALTGNLAHSYDYGRLAAMAEFVMKEARFRLLESAALCLVRLALMPGVAGAWTTPVAAAATIRKPTILPMPAVPAIRVERRATEVAFSTANGGLTIFSCPDATVVFFGNNMSPKGNSSQRAVLEVTPGAHLVVERLGS